MQSLGETSVDAHPFFQYRSLEQHAPLCIPSNALPEALHASPYPGLGLVDDEVDAVAVSRHLGLIRRAHEMQALQVLLEVRLGGGNVGHARHELWQPGYGRADVIQ